MYCSLISSLLFILIINIIYGLNFDYTSMDCYSDNNYINDWDGKHDNRQTNYFLNGQYSYHDNKKEDRLFKWRYCKPLSSSFSFISTNSLSQTSYDSEWTKTCKTINDNSAINGIYSTHDNKKEDRLFTIYCGSFDSTIYLLDNCQWTNELNSWDGKLDYDCPENGVIRSYVIKLNLLSFSFNLNLFLFVCLRIIFI